MGIIETDAPELINAPILPAVLPWLFIPADEFVGIREEAFPNHNHALPYKVLAIGPDRVPLYVGYGVHEEGRPCHLEPIAGTPDARCEQLRRAGRKCDTCEEFDPYHEMIVEREDGTTLVGYICNECFQEVLDMRKKKGFAEQQQEAARIKSKMRAIKKAERKRRRRGRR